MAQRELLRLRRVVVDGLFGIYDHDFGLKLDDRVTLLHGPNGVGKTVVLGMIDALLRKNLDDFRNIPFSRLFLEFHDGSAVDLAPAGKGSGGDGHYELELSRPGEAVRSATVRGVSRAGRIAAEIDYLHPHPELSRTWIDMRDGEVLDAEEVVSQYAAHAAEPDEAKWFGDFLENARAHFIKEQRLVRVDLSSIWRMRRVMTSRRSKPIIFAVDECSEHFRKRVAETLVQYGRESQALDQTFPRWLISARDEMPVDKLREQMSDLDRGRRLRQPEGRGRSSPQRREHGRSRSGVHALPLTRVGKAPCRMRIGLRGVLGVGAGVGRERISGILRTGFSSSDLRATTLWKDVRTWEAANVPFRILEN